MKSIRFFTVFMIAASVLALGTIAYAQEAAPAAGSGLSTVRSTLQNSSISTEESVRAAATKAPAAPSVKYGVMTASDVRVRKEPSTSAEIIGHASTGDRFQWLGERSGFINAKFDSGLTGWVSAQFATAAGQTGDTGATASQSQVGAMTGQGVFVRSEASATGKKIHDVLYGAKFKVIETKGEFVKVTFDDGVTGWVPKKYTTLTDKALIDGPEYSAAAFAAAYDEFKRTYADYTKTRSAASYNTFKKAYFNYRELSKRSPEYAAMLNNPALTKVIVDKKTFTATVYHNDKPVRAFPIAYGSNPDGKSKQAVGDCRTPEGNFKVLYKEKRPYEGVATRAMWLDTRWGDIGFHGTPMPDSIGSKASHGCIRMYSQDSIELFKIVRNGTPVTVRSNDAAI